MTVVLSGQVRCNQSSRGKSYAESFHDLFDEAVLPNDLHSGHVAGCAWWFHQLSAAPGCTSNQQTVEEGEAFV